MGHGACTKFDVTIASGASTSSEIDLGRAWRRVFLDPTGAGGECRFQAAVAAGGTFRMIQWSAANSGTAGTATVGSALSGSLVEVPLGGLRHVKVFVTGTVANGVTLKLYGSDM